jgi:malate synthase
MEDAATAEISRAQVWQWIHHAVRLDNAVVVTSDLVEELIGSEIARIASELGTSSMQERRFGDAKAVFLRAATAEPFEEFLTLATYELLVHDEPSLSMNAPPAPGASA